MRLKATVHAGHLVHPQTTLSVCKWGLEFKKWGGAWQDGVWTVWPGRHPHLSLKGHSSLRGDSRSTEALHKDSDKIIIDGVRDSGKIEKGKGQPFLGQKEATGLLPGTRVG